MKLRIFWTKRIVPRLPEKTSNKGLLFRSQTERKGASYVRDLTKKVHGLEFWFRFSYQLFATEISNALCFSVP